MSNTEQQLQQEIIESTGAQLHAENNMNVFKKKLAAYLNDLINHDFNKLIFLLYRVDINENKLKELLAAANKNAGLLIAEMMIERQQQKIQSREQLKRNNNAVADEDKW